MKNYILCAFVLVWSGSLAQTGPGGVGDATNNVLWLSADNGVYSNTAGTTPASDGDRVGLWTDRSGNGHHASHGTAAERPDFEDNVLNGLPVIRFDAGNGTRLLSSGLPHSGTASVWAVAAWTSMQSNNPGIIQAAPTGSPFSTSTGEKTIGMWVSSSGSNAVWGRGIQANGTSRDIPQVVGTSSSTFYSFLSLYDGSTILQYVNNGVSGSIGYNGTLASWSEFGIGRQANESWDGDIAEVIVFNTAVNSTQRIIINNYLSAKYELPLAANNVYAMDNGGNGDFDFDVAGIGRLSSTDFHDDAQGSGIVRILNPTALSNNDFFMWGHDGGAAQATVTTGLPGGVTSRFERIWRISETGEVGNLDLEFDLTMLPDFAALSNCDVALSLRLLIDTDGDGFADQTPIVGATNIGGNIYRFANVSGLENGMRFTLAMLDPSSDGPAGVGNTAGNSSLKLWFRTDNGVNATGSAVDSWVNSAGITDLNISEAGAQRPTRVSGAVNGLDEISFNGANRLRTGFTLTPSNFVTDEASTFVVSRADNTTQNSSLYLTDPLETNRFSTHIPWSGTVYYDIGNCCGNEARLQVTGLTGLAGYSVWSYDADPASGKQVYRDGTLLQDRALTSTYSSHATHRFNIGGNTSGSAGFVGDVTEVIIFNNKVNAAQRIIIQNYLAAKYGLTLTDNDIYTRDNNGQGNYDYDVAGIGRVNGSNQHSDSRGTGIVRVLNPTSLENNDWFFWGHNGAAIDAIEETDVPAGIERRLARAWRVSEMNNVGNIDIYFDMSGMGPVTTSDLRLLVDNNGTFATGSIAQYTATALACDQYAFLGIPGGNMNGNVFTLGTINRTQTPLPIELMSFDGAMVSGSAHLKWKTATETNNHFFTIERSLDGKNFKRLGEVTGFGTTREEKSYTYADRFPPFEVLYYRLKQTDFDGAYSYSDVIRLDNRASGTRLIASPNPIEDGGTMTLRIMHPEMVDMSLVEVRVFDVVGRQVTVNISEAGEGNLQLTFAPATPSGIYLITAVSRKARLSLATRIFRQ